jgi:hypothetical protein
MPLVIQRSAKVYRLWVQADVSALFEDHAAVGWLCTLTCVPPELVWQVAMQKAATRQMVTAPLTEVVVSDLVSVQAMTVAEFNAAYPNDAIEEPGS